MANTFKRYVETGIGTTETTLRTVATATTTVMVGLQVANVTSSQVKVTAKAAGANLVVNAPVAAGGALALLDGKVILEPGDTVTVESDTAASVDAILSVLEQT